MGRPLRRHVSNGLIFTALYSIDYPGGISYMVIGNTTSSVFSLKKLSRITILLLFCLGLALAGLSPAPSALAAPNDAPLEQGAVCTPGTPVRVLTLSNSFSSTCDDCAANNQTLGFNINFLGNTRGNITVTSNGFLRFGNPGTNIDYTPFHMSASSFVIMAAAFADVDLNGGGSVSYGQTTVGGRAAYAVTYNNVGYYNSHGNLRNTFQVVLIDRTDTGAGNFDLEYNYGQIQWETGDASDGSGGLGGTSMVVGYSAGDGVHYAEFPGSLVNGALLDSNLSTGLIHNSLNSTTCGRYIMEMRNGTNPNTPAAVADSYTASRNATLNVAVPGVLENDTDPQSDSLTAVQTSGTAHGSLALNSDGSFTYTPTTGYSGPDSFQYQATDGYFASNVATVTLTVANDPPVISEENPVSVSMSEDSSPTAFDLTLHATDANLDTLTWSLLSAPTHGNAHAAGSGDTLSPTYTPDPDFNGSDSFEVQVVDGFGGTDIITVEVTVDPVNDDPVITEGDATSVTMDEDGDPTAFDLTLNATDIDNAPAELSWSISSDPAHGTAGVEASGGSVSVTYTPNADYNGLDSFEVQVNDGAGGTDTITVDVSVDAQPDAPRITESSPASVNMDEDGNPTAFSLTLHGSDPDGDTFTWSLLSIPSNGTALADGTDPALAVSYTPAPDYNGSDSFTIQLEDSTGRSTSLEVQVEIQPVNDSPTITEGDSTNVTMDEDGAPTAFNLSLHATDIDNVPAELGWSISADPAHGTAGVEASGASVSLTYTPDADYNGPDSFEVQVEDGAGGTDTITVEVTLDAVDDNPIITEGDSIPVTMDEDGDPTAFDLTLHATDIDNLPAELGWSITGDPAHGAAGVEASGGSVSVTYTPNADYNGPDSFEVQVDDGAGGTDTIAVYVTVDPVNDGPVITEGDSTNVTMDEDGDPTAFDLTLHATDLDNVPAELGWSISADPAHGTAGVEASGASVSLTYTPDADYNGPDSFEVQVDDGSGGTDTITVEVTLDAVNDSPVIIEGDTTTVSMDEDSTPTAFALTLHATDAELDTLTWSLSSAPDHGNAAAAGIGDNLVVAYTPEPDFAGMDTFVVQVADPNGGSDAIEVVVQVAGFNDLPQVTAGADQQAVEGDTVSFTGSYVDPDGPGIPTILWDFGDSGTAAGTLAPQHVYQDNGTYTVSLTVTDEGGVPVSSELHVTVANAAPQLDPIPDNQAEVAQLFMFNVTFSDPGVADTHFAEIDWGDGSLGPADSLSSPGTFRASHTYLAEGTYTVLVTVGDDDGGESSTQFEVFVTPPSEPIRFRIIVPVIMNNSGH
jgi:VCBS repeat-containing protein